MLWRTVKQLHTDPVLLLTAAETLVVKNPVRKGTASTRFKKETGKSVPSGMHVDHRVDLQLGGADDMKTNAGPLDASVNTSLGKQIDHRIRSLTAGTPIGEVTIIDRPEKPKKVK